MKKIVVLGSTGSIGTQTLNILNQYKDYYQVLALSTNNNIDLLEEQYRTFRPKKISVANEKKAAILKSRINVNIITGDDSLIELSTMDEADIIVISVVGIAGLKATLAALEAGKDVALANKEALVAGGQLVMETAKRTGSKIYPVDSEHSAIFQCLHGTVNPTREINKIYLTASGGPFRGFSHEELKNVKVSDALKHPKWKMGKKITIDSATLMNKGLEVIEAKWLFNLSLEKINVLVHPQSVIHSMVEYIDGAIIAQMGIPDMSIPIMYALSYPTRLPSICKSLDFMEVGALTFEQPDCTVFPCLHLAYNALREGGTMPAVLNAANEIVVEKFLKNKIKFIEIPKYIELAMSAHKVTSNPSLDDIFNADKSTRALVNENIL